MTDIKLTFDGGLAENHVLDFYDAARALTGFQRSLALTAHLVLNGEIITQAPSLKNIEILTTTPAAGSWEIVATIVGGIWAVANAGKETPIGHMLFSVYNYVISNTLGFNVDYKESLYKRYQSSLAEKNITHEKLDSLMEKVESSISDIHRPIIASKSANSAKLFFINHKEKLQIGPEFSYLTYDYISRTIIVDQEIKHSGLVSSYNLNTYKGRIFLLDEGRPIPFELTDAAKTSPQINLIVSSLRSNAVERFTAAGNVNLYGKRLETSTGRLKALLVSKVEAGRGNQL